VEPPPFHRLVWLGAVIGAGVALLLMAAVVGVVGAWLLL
jgi:hypothetical protein